MSALLERGIITFTEPTSGRLLCLGSLVFGKVLCTIWQPHRHRRVCLHGRDEIQVSYGKVGVSDKFHNIGAIYDYLAPVVELPGKPETACSR